eukprot:4428309-Amphidinium_carterae.2
MEASSDASAAIWSLHDTPLLWERTLLFDAPAITGAGILGQKGYCGNDISPNQNQPKKHARKSNTQIYPRVHLRVDPRREKAPVL